MLTGTQGLALRTSRVQPTVNKFESHKLRVAIIEGSTELRLRSLQRVYREGISISGSPSGGAALPIIYNVRLAKKERNTLLNIGWTIFHWCCTPALVSESHLRDAAIRATPNQATATRPAGHCNRNVSAVTI